MKLYTRTLADGSVVGTIMEAVADRATQTFDLEENLQLSYRDVHDGVDLDRQVARARSLFDVHVELLNLKETIEAIEEGDGTQVAQAPDGRYEVQQDWVFCGYYTAQELQELWMEMPGEVEPSRDELKREVQSLEKRASRLANDRDDLEDQKERLRGEVKRKNDELLEVKNDRRELRGLLREVRGEVGQAAAIALLADGMHCATIAEILMGGDAVLLKGYSADNKIHAIKAVRAAGDLGLKEAKGIVDRLDPSSKAYTGRPETILHAVSEDTAKNLANYFDLDMVVGQELTTIEETYRSDREDFEEQAEGYESSGSSIRRQS